MNLDPSYQCENKWHHLCSDSDCDCECHEYLREIHKYNLPDAGNSGTH